MKDYTSNEPTFSSKIQVVETTDPAHADNINAAPKQLLQNTLANRQVLEGLFGFNYEGNGLLNNILGCVRDGETLIIPAGMGVVEGETLTLTGGIPYVPTGSGGSVSSIPAATASTPGVVKIGEGIDVSEDGTISVDTEECAEKAASIVEANVEDFSEEEMSNLLKLV